MLRRLSLLFALLLAGPSLASAQQHAAQDSAHTRVAKDTLSAIYKRTTSPTIRRQVTWLKAREDSVAKYAGTAYRVDTLTRTTTDTVIVARTDTIRITDTVVVAVKDSTPTPPPPPPPAPVDTTTKPDTTTPPPPPPPAPIFSHPFAPPANGALLAELPRDTVSVAPLPVTRTISVTSLQAALDTARAGDLLLLAPGSVHRNVVVRRSGVTIRTAGFTTSGTRTAPADVTALRLATVTTGTTGSASDAALTIGNFVDGFRAEGVTFTPGFSGITAVVIVGPGTTDINAIPRRVVFKNVVIDCGATLDTRRGLRLDAAYGAFMDGSIVNCHSNNSDSQAILSINTPGPLRIENSRLEGGHMAFMAGGGSPTVANMIPSDIVVRRNWMGRPIGWKGVWKAKTTFELKIGKRVLAEGNELHNHWPEGQGYAVNIKTEDQDGLAKWSQTADVTFRWNKIVCAGAFMQLNANPGSWPAVPAARVTVYGNVADSVNVAPCNGGAGTGDGFQIGAVSDVVFRDNWIRNPLSRSCVYSIGSSPRFVLTGNACGGEYGFKVDGGGALTQGVMTNGLLSGNTLMPWGTTFGAWPAAPVDSTRDALLRGVGQ